MVERDAAPPSPTLRVSTAFRAGFVVRFVAADAFPLPTFAWPVVLFDLRVLAVFAPVAFDGAAIVAVAFFVAREAGRASSCGNVLTTVS